MIRNALAVFPPSPLLPRKTSKLVKNKTRHWLNKREKGGEGKQTESVQSLQAVKIPPQLSPIPVAFRGHLCILILPPCCNRFKLSHAGTKGPKRTAHIWPSLRRKESLWKRWRIEERRRSKGWCLAVTTGENKRIMRFCSDCVSTDKAY